jgi:hypothetical protein
MVSVSAAATMMMVAVVRGLRDRRRRCSYRKEEE